MSWYINLFVMSMFVNFNIINEKFFLWLFFEIQRISFIFRLEWNVAFILFKRFNRLYFVFLALIEDVLYAYFMYYNDVDLTLLISSFTNVFYSIFIISQCFAWLFIVDLKHDDFFKVTSCCQYILSRALLCLNISRLFHNFFRSHSLCYLNFLLFDHFNCSF